MHQFKPIFSRRYVEQEACDILARCLNQSWLEKLPLPVPIEEWIERFQKVQVHFTPIEPEAGRSGSGAVRKALDGDGYEILIDPSIERNDTLVRYTVAHEYAHVLFDKQYLDHGPAQQKLFRLMVTDHEKEDEKRRERRANQFAAAILMPWKPFSHAAIEVAAATGYDLIELIEYTRRTGRANPTYWLNSIFVPLSRQFDVSLSATAYRFSDLSYQEKPLLDWAIIQGMLPSGARYMRR